MRHGGCVDNERGHAAEALGAEQSTETAGGAVAGDGEESQSFRGAGRGGEVEETDIGRMSQLDCSIWLS